MTIDKKLSIYLTKIILIYINDCFPCMFLKQTLQPVIAMGGRNNEKKEFGSKKRQMMNGKKKI